MYGTNICGQQRQFNLHYNFWLEAVLGSPPLHERACIMMAYTIQYIFNLSYLKGFLL